MEIHQLEYFLAVKSYRNFSIAAQEICISQSTLSQQIKKLEDELGVKLFIRYSRSVGLTPAGEDFSLHAQKIIDEIKHTHETVQKYKSLDKGYIRIGTFPNINYLGLEKILIRFIRQYPGIEVQIYTATTNELLKELREKKIHAAFINSPISGNYEIDFYPLIKDKMVSVLPSNHPLAHQSIIDLADLSCEKFLMDNSHPWVRNEINQACIDAGFEPSVILDCYQIEMIQSFLEDGVGVSLIGSRIAESINSPHISIIPIKQRIERNSGLALPKFTSKKTPIATNVLRDFILTEFEKLPINIQ